MPIKWGNLTIEKIFSGTNKINKVLLGTNTLFEGITLTPTTAVLTSTTTSVNFRLTQTDPVSATMTWQIRSGSNSGTIVASGTTPSTAQNATQDVSATVSAGVTYFLTGVTATATGKSVSLAATERNAILITATPGVQGWTQSSTSVTFRLTQLDSVASPMTWQIRASSTGGTIVNSGTTSSTALNGVVDVSATGLSASTTHWLTGVTATASGKTISATAGAVSRATDAPPPFFPPFFPPNFPPFFPPFFPPNFVPPFFPPFFPPNFPPFFPPFFPPNFPPRFGGCLHEDTLMTMFDGTQKLLKDIVIGDELMGYHIDGMIDEEEPGWENWTTENHLSGEIVPVAVTGVKQDAYSSYYLINDDIKITKQHRFFASTDAITWTWIDSSDLKVGDKLLDIDKNIIEITSKLYIQEALHVVVLDVETTDNYFAGQSHILIHNSTEFK